MAIFTLRCEHEDDGFFKSPPETVEFTMDGSPNLDTLLEFIQRYVRACGYEFRGSLDFVPDEEEDTGVKLV